jgi:subtilisin family serine protease
VIAFTTLVAAALALPHAATPGQQAVGFTEVPGANEFRGALIVRPRQDLRRAERERALALLAQWPNRRNHRTDEFVVEVGIAPMAIGSAENAAVQRLMKTGLFQYACPDWTLYPLATPNDPRYPEQWHHAMMQSAQAWDIVRADGAKEIIIAVTDTGIVPHEDLGNRVPGFNSASDIAETDGGDLTDIHGHGTHVAGCAAASGNNGLGVSGPGWNYRIMPVRVSEATNGGAAMSNLLEGVQWAAEHGAKVISTSYSGIGYEPIETTGQFVHSLDASMLWAAGNSATNHSGWDFPNVVVVGASDPSDQRAGFSSYGRGVDLFAPGVSILSSTRDGGYNFASGTSMATPVANGALALVRTANPALAAVHAEHILFHSCDFWGVADNETYGWGRVNLRRAVEYAIAAGSQQAPVARDDRAVTITEASVELDVLANDFDANMDALEIQSFTPTTSTGAAVTLIEGGAGARDRLLVANVGSAPGQQTLSYTLVEPVSGATSTAVAVIESLTGRTPENPVGALPGVDVAYYALEAPSVLPDFSLLTSYAAEIVPQINFASTGDVFAGSGRADNVGAVYTGWIDVPATGIWTLSVTSDDGSKLYLGNDLVANNDGLHGMATVSGTRGLRAGKHALRVEFFEAGGGAGVILAWSGPGAATGAVPAANLLHGGSVPTGDLNGDGIINSIDLGILLNAWGASGSSADLNGNGIVDSADIAVLLSNWTV